MSRVADSRKEGWGGWEEVAQRQEAREVSEEEEPGVGWRRCTITGFYWPLKGKLPCKKGKFILRKLQEPNCTKDLLKSHPTFLHSRLALVDG